MNGRLTALSDTATLAMRTLKHNLRSSDTIMTVLATPLMILLAFVFVLGGSMDTGPVRYVDFVVPVVLMLAIASGVSYTAFRVNGDVSSGMYARLRTMPIARSALTGGHVVASVIVNGVAVVILLGVAMAIGYRPSTGWMGWGVTVGLLLGALVAFSIMGVGFGLAAKTAEGSTVFSYLLMGLLFVSSGFAPTGAMPAAVRAFADHQPMTSIIDAIRDAQLGQVDPGATVRACAWLAAVIVGFGALTGAMGRRRAALLG